MKSDLPRLKCYKLEVIFVPLVSENNKRHDIVNALNKCLDLSLTLNDIKKNAVRCLRNLKGKQFFTGSKIADELIDNNTKIFKLLRLSGYLVQKCLSIICLM